MKRVMLVCVLLAGCGMGVEAADEAAPASASQEIIVLTPGRPSCDTVCANEKTEIARISCIKKCIISRGGR